MSQLPYEILEAMIQCFGRSFHFKDRMAAFLANCEVPKTLVSYGNKSPQEARGLGIDANGFNRNKCLHMWFGFHH